MYDSVPRTRLVRHRHEHGWWTLAYGRPDPRFGEHVIDYCSYAEQSAQPVRRREVPFAGVPVIISFGPSIRISGGLAPGPVEHRSFLAGLDDGVTITEYDGVQDGVQVNLTPVGAYLLLGQPLDPLARRVVRLEDVLGAEAGRLAARLYEAASPAARFAVLDSFIAARLARARPASRAVVWAWQQLRESDGAIAIGRLAEEIGWSRKHLIARFREQIGLPPKTLAQVLRFRAAVRRLERADGGSLAEIALDCGYYDQAHFNRDFQRFAGIAPSEFLRRRVGDGSGSILA